MAPAAKGLDDYDLDGNWATAGDDEPLQLSGRPPARKKKRKKGSLAGPSDPTEVVVQAVGADAGVSAERNALVTDEPGGNASRPAKKRRRRSSVLGASGEGSGTAGSIVRTKKLKEKKKRQKMLAAGELGLPSKDAPCDALTDWAAKRLTSSWAAEAKAASLSALEVRELVPVPTWFASCHPGSTLVHLRRTLVPDSAACPSSHQTTKGPSILVLGSSTERVFALISDLEAAWKVKPAALAAHGGGRKRDQLERQAKAFGTTPIAVGTPGRVLRLFEEKLVDVASLQFVVLDLAIDRKKRDILSLLDTRRDVFGLLRRFFAHGLAIGQGPRLVMCCAGKTMHGHEAATGMH